MNGTEFRKKFHTNNKTAVFPVIHVLTHEQTSLNVQIAIEESCAGVFLINHDFDVDQFLPIVRSVREQFPEFWLGVNFLAVTGKIAFPILAELEKNGCRVDGYWADDARIDESAEIDQQVEAAGILEVKRRCGWGGMYFGGTAFKKQREVESQFFNRSAEIATHWMDVVTTSGSATGIAVGTEKTRVFRNGVGNSALALASGITPENIGSYTHLIDACLVATGINLENDFYNIDRIRLSKLMERV
ncbi:MAG: putative TIM-barrel enzyme [Gammaproteobacteria bacterium]|jgi:predicted TIM-barrel enzyme